MVEGQKSSKGNSIAMLVRHNLDMDVKRGHQAVGSATIGVA